MTGPQLDSESWTCASCGGLFIGGRTPDDLCGQCLASRLATARPAGAELAARITAAAAVRTDFERASYDYAMQGGPVPDWATWSQRLSLALAAVLDGLGAAL